MTHATLPWAGEEDRRTLFYKYCPVHVAWSGLAYDPDDYPALTPAEHLRLAPPGGWDQWDRQLEVRAARARAWPGKL
jgi:hypothetical protein